MTVAVTKRQRLSRESRRAHVLDCAADIVARDGVNGLTMEQVSIDMGVSKSLIYNYFPNTTDLLREVLQRELKTLRRAQSIAAGAARDFEEMVRSVTHVYIEHVSQRGLIIQRLQAEPSISDLHDPTAYDRDVAVDYLAGLVVKHFGLPLDMARAATDISFGVPASAGEYLLGKSTDPAAIEEMTAAMIVGMFQSLSARYHAGELKADSLRPPAAPAGRGGRRGPETP